MVARSIGKVLGTVLAATHQVATQVLPASRKRSHASFTYDGSCGRCGGTGFIPRYGHIRGGICFRCEGSGRER